MAKANRKTSKRNKNFVVNGSIWVESNGERFFGPGPVELLERIAKTGSINQAAKQMQMSYKKAWEIINALNTNAGHPYVVTQTGGTSGGGSTITEEAKAMIALYRQLREKFNAFLEKETQKLNG
jgi:molybdate transport system regulatory protein